ncbi:class A beta-lactamase-related serine hydrolase [Amycolatopsis acidiphila]|uniref:Serine hydrolase n=1 Tax=Amycolatopsis acidiphila TaxID=715473 RepID=A0A558A8E6_9PSEU|nr:serine hydrolase [Amycolatopsis acidiphila]TVT20518.1 serine hydrolase [Amycolatopsis acidiphila]UIJ57043.1 class A beta-lactamase-related serine hydrolase [Amycolatopsis acidiphila]GHG53689.1 serine hydrolase [Amycolatopsis acidiphila]
MSVEGRLREVFRDAGVRGWVHARPVTGDGEVGFGADDPVVMASTYKVVVLAAFCRAVDDGEIDPREPVTVHPDTRTEGPAGLSALRDAVTMTWRDLATSMITVSDNAAADAVHRRLGAGRVQAVLDDLALTATTVRGGTDDVHRMLVQDTAAHDVATAFAVLTDNNATAAIRALDPVYGSATTPREMTRLMSALWRGDVASPEQTAFARQVLLAQVWTHRLRAGFPGAVRVAGKTGTLGAVRNEVGVVSYPDEHPVAVAVFTHAARAEATVPRADAAIGTAAYHAVAPLREPEPHAAR